MGKLFHSLKSIFSKRRNWLLLVAGLVTIIGVLVVFYFLERPPVLSQQAIFSLKEVSMPTSGQKVLVISPHPDDETIALAGIIAQSRKNGANIKIVLVTNGNMHHNEATRYAEFKTATGILGVDESSLVFLNLPDGKLDELDQGMIYQLLKGQIDSYNPDIVLYPHVKDKNPDHSTTGKIVAEILKAEPDKRTAYQFLVHYEIFYPEPRTFDPSLYLLPPKTLVKSDKEWQRFMLPQDIEDLKISATFSYKSQLKNSFLRELMLSSIRKNELLAVPAE